MSVFCAEARGTVMHRRTATTGVVVRRALVRRYDSHFHHCAVLRVSSRASREPAGSPIAPWQPPAPQFARSPRRSRRHALKTHIWIAKRGLPLDRHSTYDMLQIPRVALLEQVPLHQLRTPLPGARLLRFRAPLHQRITHHERWESRKIAIRRQQFRNTVRHTKCCDTRVMDARSGDLSRQQERAQRGPVRRPIFAQ